MSIHLDLIQTVGLTAVLLLAGEATRRRVRVLERFSIPGPVVGGLAFALAVLALRESGLATVDVDTSLQQPAMVAFFTTIGLSGSLRLLRKGGRALAVYLVACWTLAITQNLVGVALAKLLGVDSLLGIMAGAVSLEGGHGAAAAFGPTAEALGAHGAKAVAIAAATFGLVMGGLLGGPVATWLMRRHRVPVAAASVGGSDAGDADTSGEAPEPVSYASMLVTGCVIAVIMVLGVALGAWFSATTGFMLPDYVGAMIVAAVARNLNDRLGLVRIHTPSVGLISGLSLGFFLTMAMMSLRIWDLYALALPLVVILVVQVAFLLLFVTQVVFRVLGRDYDAATMCAGMMGHGLGGTPNAVACMDAFGRRFGVRSDKAFLVVPLAGAVLIDIVALPWITWCIDYFA